MDLRPAKNYRPSVDYTKGQEEAINQILDWANNITIKPFTLSGFAGTGKTTLLKDVVNSLVGTIACSAPTHKAARIAATSIGAETSTIHKLLGLRPNTDLDNFDVNNPQFDPLAKATIGNYKYVIVDECSMINKSLYKLLLEIAGKYGTKLLFVGDPYQLPPVKENYSLTFYNDNLYNLTEIVRQDEDNPLIKLLNLAREAVKSKDDRLIKFLYNKPSMFNENNDGYAVYNGFNFLTVVNDLFQSDDFTNNVDYCRYAAFTNASVNSHNEYVREMLLGKLNEPVHHDDLFTSYSTILNEFNNAIIINSEDYIVSNILNYNNKYMLTGYLVKLKQINGGFLTDDIFIVNHYDSDNVNNYVARFTKLLTVARNSSRAARRRAWEKFYEFKNYNLLVTDIKSSNGTLIASKDIDYGFGLTIHKTQGSTFDNILINARDIIYSKNGVPYSNVNLRNRLFYVALSRAKKGAFITL